METNLMHYFETRTSHQGEKFTTLKDDAPEWLRDAVREAHDNEFPNDWRYEMCLGIAEAIAMCDEINEDTVYDLNLDSLVDVYTSDLTRWLADDVNRLSLVDEVRESWGYDDSVSTFNILQGAQLYAMEGMARIIVAAMLESEDEDV